MKMPFLDLTRQYAGLKKDVMSRFEKLLDAQTLIGGEAVATFESDIAKWIGVKHAITVASGTDSLILSLRALNVGPGDEVITPAFSFFASTSCILLCGAKPVFVDIDPRTYNMDPSKIEKAVTAKTKCILPVHLYGQCAEMDAILNVAKKKNLFVLEDFAQSIGARDLKVGAAGTMGDIGATSFYPTKNLGGAGEGGLITTNDDELAKRVRLLKVHGMEKRYYHDVLGTNSRMDALQAAYLHVKLPHLKRWVTRRAEIAMRYMQELADLNKYGLVLPFVGQDQVPVWNQFVIRVLNRDRVRELLAQEGIPTDIYYPLTIPEQTILRPICEPKGWPEAEKAARSVLALPVFPEMTEEEQGWVIEALRKVVPEVMRSERG